MLFKFQWHIEKHFLELDLGPGLISVSPESNIIEIHYMRYEIHYMRYTILNMAK